MPPKLIKPGTEHGYIGEKKSMGKPREIVMSEYMEDYLLDRDRILWKISDNDTKEQLKLKYKK